MAAERTTCITLVTEVEKYPLLYSYKLPEYSRKDLTEKAWAEIAHKMKLTVSECKEKWRNIRSTFLRSTKAQPSGSKTIKPYYLSEHLTFILPYVKPLNDSDNRGNVPPIPDTEMTNEADTKEQVSNEGPTESSEQHQPPALQDQSMSSKASAPVHGVRRRKTTALEIDAAMINFLKNKTNKAEEVILNKTEKQMNLFFQSLLPEFTDMNPQQIRSFKIKVLQFIDDIKNAPSVTSSRDSTPCTSRESYYTVYSPISSVGTPAPTPINYQNEPPASINYRKEPPAQMNYQSESSPVYQNQAMPINFSAQSHSVGTPAPTPINYQNEPPASINYRKEPPTQMNYQSESSPVYQNQAMPINFSAQSI